MKIYIHKFMGKLWYVCNDIYEIEKFSKQEYDIISRYCILNKVCIDICKDKRDMAHKKKFSNYDIENTIRIN